MSDDLRKISFVLNKGVNRDAPPGSLEAGYASDLRHIGFDDGVCFKRPGVTSYFSTAAAAQINGLYAFSSGATSYVLRGRAAKMTKITGGEATDLTPAFTGGLGDRWSFAAWGNVILASNGKEKIQKFVSPYAAGDLADMTADANCPVAHVVRVFQRHVFALGDTTNTFRVSWSDIDDYTDWTAIAANDAGSVDLYESKTPVVGGDTLRTIFVVYTGSQIHTFQYVGGTYVFARNIADYSTGLYSRDLLVSTEYAQFFMSPTNFCAFDGSKPVPIGQGIRKEVYAGIAHAISSHSASIDYAFAFHARNKGEVWFCVPVNQAYPDLAVIYNYWNGAWSLEDFDEGYLACAGIDQSPLGYPLMALGDHKLWYIEYGSNKAAGTAYTGYIDSPEFEGSDAEIMKHIVRIVPDITAAGSHTVSFKVGTRDTRNSSVTWSSAYTFDPDSDKHLDVRASGRLLRLRVYTDALASPFQLNKVDVYYAEVGGR